MIFFVIVLILILIFYSTLNIDIMEFGMIVSGFLFIIWVLTRPDKKKELYTDTVEDNSSLTNVDNGGIVIDETTTVVEQECIQPSYLESLFSIPDIVQKNIEPPLQQLVDVAKGASNDDDGDTILLRTTSYVKSEDTEIGAFEIVDGKDLMGNPEKQKKFTVDEQRFQQMKSDYMKINYVLKQLKLGNLNLYNQIIP